jgi:hypothetical protein
MITNALNVHLNIEQSTLINTTSIIMSQKIMTMDTLSSQMIKLTENTQISLPEDLFLNSTTNSTISLRVSSSLCMYLLWISLYNFSMSKHH